MSMAVPLEKIDDYRYLIAPDFQNEAMKRHGLEMNVPGLVYADHAMLDILERDKSLDQVANVATLPGIVGYSLAMPDIHQGYGFPIGGVAAFDAEKGVISPGGVGYDINCGVRLIGSCLDSSEVKPKLEKLVNTIFSNVPCGVGSNGRLQLSSDEMDQVLVNGARWAVDNNYGWPEDMEFMEEQGAVSGVNPDMIGYKARRRGAGQLGTLGAGNHFIEIQRVDQIFDLETARIFGIQRVGQVMIMIHTGSRGLGHQVCTDYLDLMRQTNLKYGIPLIDRELSCAPCNSEEGQRYFSAMNGAANFAWANRQLIMHWVRESFQVVMKQSASKLGLSLVYDIAHNMAKLEKHNYGGKDGLFYVHRKGATRAFGPGSMEIPKQYRTAGQPVLIPGDMGTASYLLAGTKKAMNETFGSSCHGAGRLLSRTASKKQNPPDKVICELEKKGIYLRAQSRNVVSEEAPGAYKDVNNVVDISHQAGITRKIARMKPMGVVKG